MKEALIGFRVTPEEKTVIEAMAAELGMTKSQYIINVLKWHTDFRKRVVSLASNIPKLERNEAGVK